MSVVCETNRIEGRCVVSSPQAQLALMCACCGGGGGCGAVAASAVMLGAADRKETHWTSGEDSTWRKHEYAHNVHAPEMTTTIGYTSTGHNCIQVKCGWCVVCV